MWQGLKKPNDAWADEMTRLGQVMGKWETPLYYSYLPCWLALEADLDEKGISGGPCHGSESTEKDNSGSEVCDASDKNMSHGDILSTLKVKGNAPLEVSKECSKLRANKLENTALDVQQPNSPHMLYSVVPFRDYSWASNCPDWIISNQDCND